jgi:thiamine biosynthesis lipoprotein ApbE
VVLRAGALVAALVALCACVEPVHREREWTALDRPASAEVWATTERVADRLLDSFPAAMERVDATQSVHRSDSELNRLNAEARAGYYRVEDHDLFRAVSLAVDYAKASEGDYDPTIGPALRLYEQARPGQPDETALEKVLEAVEWDAVVLERGIFAVHFLRPGMQIDLDGMIEGYAIDVAARKFVLTGSLAGLLRLGPHVYAWGRPPDIDEWWVEVHDPRSAGARPLLRVRIEQSRGIGVSGSGGASDLVIDPTTGKPASSDAAVAVAFADSVADAAAVSRALLVGGSSRAGVLLSERTRRVEAVLFPRDEEAPVVLASASLQGRVELADGADRGTLRFLLPPTELVGRLD